MESQEFKEFSHAMIDYIINYHKNIRNREVYPSVKPGYLYSKIPKEAPNDPDKWKNIMDDIEKIIMPGITHWQSPRFHAYFPAGLSYPSIVGEILSAGLGVIGFNWIASPACTELEMVMLDWLGKMMNLPSQFINSAEGPGGGMIQGSASEATLIGLLAAKAKTVHRMKTVYCELDENAIKSKLVAYSSDQSNSSVEKAGILGSMMMRLLPTDSEGRLRGDTLKAALEEDSQNGLIPCYVIATLGTTGTCAFDCLQEIGPVCQLQSVWLHVDAAYAGAAFICPEYQYLMAGMEYADSLVINVHKWLLVNFDCSAMWVKNCQDLSNAFNVERIYLEDKSKTAIPELRNRQLSLGRRFRSLKMWFTMRLYGITGLQRYIRNDINMAKYFEQLVREDERFEVVIPAVMALTCFRLKGENCLTHQLLEKLLLSRQLYMVPATVNKDCFVIRFAITSNCTNEDDIRHDWNIIKNLASTVVSADKKFRVENIISDDDQLNLTELCTQEKYKNH